jgi:hypothetical protein
MMNKVESDICEIENLIQIEDPTLVGKKIKVKAVIASNSISYTIPTQIMVVCKNDKHKHHNHKLIDLDEEVQVELVDIRHSAMKKTLTSISGKFGFKGKCHPAIEITKQTTLKKVRIRPALSNLETKDGKITDSFGNEWKSYDVFVQQNQITKTEPGKEVKIIGKVIPDPKTQRITLIISSIESSDNHDYDLRKIKELKSILDSKPIPAKVEWITEQFTNYSKIVKRENITIAGLLTFFSPLYLEFEGKRINGWVKTVIIGDTRTAKSESICMLIKLTRCGQIITAETATMAGLGGATVQSTSNQWLVEWGFLVLHDTGLLAIDGSHNLGHDLWSQLSEAESTGEIIIAKAGKAKANVRTRQIKIMNPLREDRRTTVPMSSFLYPVKSLENNLQIQNIARQDLVIFVTDDVQVEDLNKRIASEPDPRLGYLSELLRFAWNQKYQIVFEDDAMDEILKQATILEKKFKCDDIPLVTNDQKFKLAKLSASLAALTCSFNDDFTKLIVKKEHVEYVAKLIDREYSKGGLDKLASKYNDEETNDAEVKNIVQGIKFALYRINPDDRFCNDILNWIAEQNRFTTEELWTEFELARDNLVNPLIAELKSSDIIKPTRGGFVPTRKGIKIARYLIQHNQNEGAQDPMNKTTNNNNEDSSVPSVLSEPQKMTLGESN